MPEKDNLELYEEIENGIQKDLLETKFDDPKRKDKINELTAVSSIRVSYEQAEQTRLNNNAKNDVEEAKLIIEQEKVKLDRQRNWMMFMQAFTGAFLGSGLIFKSYKMDEKGFPYRDLKMYGMKLIERLTKR